MIFIICIILYLLYSPIENTKWEIKTIATKTLKYQHIDRSSHLMSKNMSFKKLTKMTSYLHSFNFPIFGQNLTTYYSSTLLCVCCLCLFVKSVYF